ncbi:MAG TPA: preprotein translocase subunit SecE [Candidatus Dormibacteraeota bacterium]|nr:preprotein translocase subunit SecE [Candidatus Dormibacteraeota bacterium]
MAVSARRRARARREAGLGRFLQDTYDELRKVAWPTPAELYRFTVIVVVTVVVLGVFIGLVDAGLQALAGRFIYGLTGKTG